MVMCPAPAAGAARPGAQRQQHARRSGSRALHRGRPMNPSGVRPTTASAIATHPSHLGNAPFSTMESPLASRNRLLPSAIGMKSLSHRACSACTADGLDVVGRLREREADRRVDGCARPPGCGSREGDHRRASRPPLRRPQDPAQVAGEEDEGSAGRGHQERAGLTRILVVDVVVDVHQRSAAAGRPAGRRRPGGVAHRP